MTAAILGIAMALYLLCTQGRRTYTREQMVEFDEILSYPLETVRKPEQAYMKLSSCSS